MVSLPMPTLPGRYLVIDLWREKRREHTTSDEDHFAREVRN